MDLTLAAVPVYFGTMGAEHLWLRRRAARQGPTAADYEWRDTLVSLGMGVGSLLAPVVVPKLLGPLTPGKGRFGGALVGTALGAAAAVTFADRVLARAEAEADDDGDDRDGGSGTDPRAEIDLRFDTAVPGSEVGAGRRPNRAQRRRALDVARRAAAAGGVAAVVAGGIAVTSSWASRTTMPRMWNRRFARDLGGGPIALALAVLGWDFIYYWNHRFMHESRYMWAIHVVHHSSEHYNLSTALRQPVADALGTFAPYSLLALAGIRPDLIAQARAINLLYQYWIHTDTIRSLGPAEEVLNTPSHHRVHHGSNRQYLDRNHGSILILWDRLFGTFEREREPVVYGLTENIETFNPARVVSHEHTAMLRDVARSRTWRDRVSFVVRGPGWAKRRRAELDRPAAPLTALRPSA